MQFNTKDRELALKIVYYGPALSGKTTNLQALHGLLDPAARGRLMTLDTKGDRTLFFDLLPVHFQTRSGIKVKLKLYTVPGQVMHETTRRIVVQASDAICFIADSQRSQRAANNEAYRGMQRNLRAHNIDPDRIPIVIQFNKRDLPDVMSDEELAEYARRGKEPIFGAVAIRGEGVVETLRGCLQLLWKSLDAEHDFKRKLGITRDEFMNGIFQSLRGQAEEPSKEVQR
ncbi:ADP-ribosylation factor-like protein [Myxococcota bacterium]|nr:ADP-ribosylation factor-like protein [Myxococcota bacterium]